jgi:quercetin 2,3-dioxygenase
MIHVDAQGRRYHFENEWLSAYWHFSFDHYYDPERTHFSALRVFNDDSIRPRHGFPMHAHREMEIVTVVLAGTLEHEDNQGNRGVLEADEVQVMSAGTGIVHAERNPSLTVPLHMLQIWITPDGPGGRPRWAQGAFRRGTAQPPLLALASGESRPGALPIGQAATIYRAKLGPGEAMTHDLRPGRRAYLFSIAGRVAVDQAVLEPGDAARVEHERTLAVRAERSADLLLLDLP